MYFKQYMGTLCSQKMREPQWVQWIHHSEGGSHCQVCLMLDRCLFLAGKTPPCPHHPNCHCTLEPVDYAIVLMLISAYSDYSKFDPYLFNTSGKYTHGKEKMFAQWGYTAIDAKWLQSEMERQAMEKYRNGNYNLGKLDAFGQRLNIRIEIPRKDGSGIVSFLSGWMVEPNGKLKLNTPYGGK